MGTIRRAGARPRATVLLVAATLVVGATSLSPTPTAAAATLPPGFRETVALSGLTNPTAVQFAADGRIFVAEKRGLIKVFDSLSDPSPDVFADLRTNVHDYWDRGLLGLALAPGFPSSPYVYALYTYDHILGDPAPAPRWGDQCPSPPGSTSDGCVVSGRLSRLEASPTGNTMVGGEQVLIEDWCQQYPSHTVGSLVFGSDGQLYVSGGDGANFNTADYGQGGGSAGSPIARNPCGDPPGGVGGSQTPPSAEGGALRSQDLRTTQDPTGLDGAVLRVDPTTGAGSAGNPLASSSDANARRIVAYGFRNPFRITERPGSGEIWVGDVGWNTWEEINRISTPADSSADNFGWPCYEGSARQPSYDNLNLTLCEELYASPGAVVQPVFTYRHTDSIVGGEACANGQGSSTVGMAFYEGGNYPAEYDGALFFADYSRDCLWVMPAGANGLPDPTKRKNFLIPASNPVHLEIGPNGDLFYVDLNGGSIRRIEYSDGNRPPVANATANPTSGQAPLTVTFDGRASTDPDGSPLTYAWDLDGNGTFGDSSSATPSYTYTSPGTYQPRLRVTDPQGASDTSPPINVEVANTPPVATIDTPAAGTTWKVGDTIAFSGHGSDAEDGALPASALRWNVVLMHCPLDCHEHPLQTLSDVSGGSFSAPDHGLPMHLELRLTATDAFGVATTATRQLHPRTVDLALRTEPAGLTLEIAGSSSTTPFTKRLIVGSTTTLSASSPQDLAGTRYEFQSWSDGKAATHSITAGATGTTYTATFTAVGPDVQGDRSTYVPITPIRVLDTRKGIGLSGEFGVNAPRSWTVAGFDGGSIPTDAVAVTGNVTVTGQSAKGYVSLTPGPNADPKSSTINFPRGDTRANNVTIPLAADGRLSAVYKATSGSTELIFDVTGYFLEGANATYSPVTPYRRVDSRNGSGMPGGSPAKFASGVPRSFGIAGSDGIPANAVAVTGNLTAVRQSSSGFLALTPDPEPAPTTSSLNFPVGDTRANGFTAPLNGSGRLSVTFVSSSSAATTDVLVDITGYFVESDDGLAYYPMAPVRAFDTRATTNTGISGPFISRTPRGLTIAGQWGTVAGARAITGNLTVTRQQQRGHVSATPASVPDPTTSTLNFPYGDTRANGAVVPLNASGGSWFVYVSPSTGMTTHLILDVTGYFAP